MRRAAADLAGIALALYVLVGIAGADATPPKLEPAAAVRIVLLQHDIAVARLGGETARAKLACAGAVEAAALREEITLSHRLAAALTAKLDREVERAAASAKLDPRLWRPDVGVLTWRRLTE